MSHPIFSPLGSTRILAGLALVFLPFSLSQAHPESSAAWMEGYGPALGLAAQDLPGHDEYIDEVTATVAVPARLAAFDIVGVARGETIVLTNHDNGYWTLHFPASGRRVTIPLAYQVRFGVVPDRDMPVGEVPDRVAGRVVAPAVLAQYGFRTAAAARRFILEWADEGWWLILEPGGEKLCVPF
jgi:hypothetical protein